MKSILIKDTTREERIRIVHQWKFHCSFGTAEGLRQSTNLILMA